jgi:hypothetical protein
MFKGTERYNVRNFWKLIKGEIYAVSGNTLTNRIAPCLYTFSRLDRWLPAKAPIIGTLKTLPPLRLDEYELVVLESNASVLLVDLINSPSTKLLYRASDPIKGWSQDSRLVEYENKVLERADLVLATNSKTQKLLIENSSGVAEKVVLWRNGFNKNGFDSCHLSPYQEGTQNCIYVGAYPVDWDCIFGCALAMPNIDFHIIGPDLASRQVLQQVSKIPNVHYYDGMQPQDTWKYIKYADVGLLPYLYKPILRYIDLTGKIYQYMYAQLPIVCFGYGAMKDLSRFHIVVANSKRQFVQGMTKCLSQQIDYSDVVDFDLLSWEGRLRELGKLLNTYKILNSK